MTESKAKITNTETESAASGVIQEISNILKPTLHDNDFLQSFVRIGLNEPLDSCYTTVSDEKHSKRRESSAVQNAELRRAKERGSSMRLQQVKSVQQVLQEERIQRTRRRRRRKSEAHRQEEVYTDKDRAAAVNMGSRDIKQSLRLKRKQDRSKALMIPEEAEPGAMLALGTRELRCGNFAIALSCINKALELSPNDKNALLARSKCHLLLGEPRKALEDAQSALRGRKKNSHSAKALFFKAEALFHLGDFELSLVYYYRGIKIRPEFDQFRLGIQKAKEAIENILGGNSVTMPKRGNPRVENSEVPRVQDKGSRTMGTEGLEVRSLEPRTSSSKHGSISLQRRVNAPGKRTGNLESRLLGQLNIDKRYLQDFVKRSGITQSTTDSGLARRMPKLKPDRDLNKEFSYGYVHGITGPVIVANRMKGTAMHEVVRVGHERLLGEVIRLDGDTATIQVYEETSGLCYGDMVERTGKPLSVELAPGLLASIYDGIQRPLKNIQELSHSIYIPRGIKLPAVSRTTLWEFHPLKLRKGTCLTGGDIIGHVYENRLVKHHIMMPPNSRGKLKYIAPTGCYAVDELILQTELEDTVTEHSMLQTWPVRQPRPVYEKIGAKRPLLTGQRVLDGLFPCSQGGSTAMPGAFGCGKTVVAQSLTKYSNSDVVVYVGCGERGNEMSEVLRDFPQLAVEVDHVREPIMKRTILVANTSNMPVAAREASVYTGISLAEYFRDQGYDVALIADSTSRWAEALREISGRLGEMPADAGYPAYMSARLAAFYERGGRARCLGNPYREGSLSVVGVVSPPAGDISEPFVSATLAVVNAFWALDKRLAERKHFPAVDWLSSYTRSLTSLGCYYETHFPQFTEMRKKAIKVLMQENEAKQLMLLIGRESLSEDEKLALDVAHLLTEDFLQQDNYSSYDHFCPFYKTYGMLRNIVSYHELACKAVVKLGQPWDVLRYKFKELQNRLGIMKFLSPIDDGEELIEQELYTLYMDIQRACEEL